MTQSIKAATLEDVTAIVMLVNRAYRPSGGTKGWTHESDIVSGERVAAEGVRAMFAPDSFIFVAEKNQQLVACIHLKIGDECAYIGMLATNPDQQQQGYGKLMLDYAERFATGHFSIRTFEMVVVSARTELIAFYIRRGYAKAGVVHAYPIAAGVGVPKVAGLTTEILRKIAHPK